jgi:hypothetical protein
MAGRAREPKHRHRVIAWSLIVLASVVLILSIIANWVQTEALDDGQLANQTDQILADQDVQQQQLSIFAVDQLYANIDVEGPDLAEAAERRSAPRGPGRGGDQAARTNVAEKALASPQVEDLVSTAVGRSGTQAPVQNARRLQTEPAMLVNPPRCRWSYSNSEGPADSNRPTLSCTSAMDCRVSAASGTDPMRACRSGLGRCPRS